MENTYPEPNTVNLGLDIPIGVPPVRIYAVPRQTLVTASVVIKAGIFPFAVIKPLIIPMQVPIATAEIKTITVLCVALKI